METVLLEPPFLNFVYRYISFSVLSQNITSFFTYDYLLSITREVTAEVDLIWKKKLRFSTALYLAARYLSFPLSIISAAPPSNLKMMQHNIFHSLCVLYVHTDSRNGRLAISCLGVLILMTEIFESFDSVAYDCSGYSSTFNLTISATYETHQASGRDFTSQFKLSSLPSSWYRHFRKSFK
ncbi:hypothetical protein K439DRAFT_1614593 [Ramaria rubella]|nr:hypothetical protein K439DRAFT_1614593 [Ramaria rubella]